MNSRDFLKNSAICASLSGEREGVGNLPLRSASSTKSRADSPVNTGEELIVIAISETSLVRMQIYKIRINYANI